MIDLITLLDRNGEREIYTGRIIHDIYRYLEMFGAPTNMTYWGQLSHYCFHSNNDATTSLEPLIESHRSRKKIICGWCGRVERKSDLLIIRGPKFLPPSIRQNMKQYNELHGKTQLNHQDIGTVNPLISNLASNTAIMPQKTVPWYNPSRGE